ncbi:MAG: hypothetical protein PVH29_12310 [Candidatus Zixiibacteriota bacterium]|jgi:hypothetical protein
MSEGNGWKSRKFVLALLGVVAGCLAAFVLPLFGPFAWLREHSVAIFAAACTLAAAYIAGNAFQARAFSNDGNPPGTEP